MHSSKDTGFAGSPPPRNAPAARRARAALQAIWLALALAACGGGVDSGGTGATSSYASGSITGFGSVIVNGVRFDDSTAAVRDEDGTLRGRDELRLGMSTEVRGSAIGTDATGASVSIARSITFGSEILGPVESVDAAAKSMVALGQTIVINAATVFDAATLAGGLVAIAPGDIVEVHALIDASTGRYTATRVERKGAVSAYRLRGVVSQLDSAARSFNIGTERFSYAAYAGSPPATLANGSYVRLRLQTSRSAGLWSVLAFKDGTPSPQDMDEVRIDGVINTFTSATLFSVDGVAVNAAGIVPPAGLALGARVEVEGSSSAGILVASKLKLKTPDEVENQDFELRGTISALDAAGLNFVLRGVTVVYSLTTTEFRDGTIADLQIARDVEARGMLSADGTRLVATRIRFR
ncbi:MAG: DUF5666 domain-containing protein [Rhizobacter sp.]|nr:DUF5666 domain-containing protein [Rhizobacter sp.]